MRNLQKKYFGLISNMEVTELGKRCPIDYTDGWAIHYRSEEDLYKITMFVPQVTYHANDWARYVFKNRTKDAKFTKEMLAEIDRQIDHLCTLNWTDAEIEYLNSIPYLKSHRGVIELLRYLKLDRRYLKDWIDEEGTLHIEAEGPVYIVSQFEIYILSIVSFVWNKFNDSYENILEEGKKRWEEKKLLFKDKYSSIKGKIAEFGVRRRNLPELQEYIVKSGLEEGIFSGTSNIYLAMKYGATPIGTYAHEYIMLFQAKKGVQLAYTNQMAMNEWLETYRGNLGIALTDTISTSIFLKDFDTLLMRQFQGVRTDSGDDFKHADNFIKAYEEHGVDPKTKTFLVSNSYDFDKALEMYNYLNGRMKFAAGIGTYITNDSTVKPLNIVMKLQAVNEKPVAKISDDKGKTMCESETYVNHLIKAIEWRLENEL